MARTTPASSNTPAVASLTDDSVLKNSENESGEVTIYPLKSYLDGKEIRHAGGDGYKSPKHDAVQLIAAGLATETEPQA